MTVPDNQLGIRPPADAVLAIVAAATSGDIDVPQSFTRIEDVVSEFTSGPLVEAAAYAIERFGLKVLCVRCAATGAAGAYGALTETGTGTSVATSDVATTQPLDDYEVFIKFVTGGTIGVDGITYQWSLDGGRTMSAVTALGVANQILIAEGGIDINLAAGTIVAGDTISVPTTAPLWSGAELSAALEALKVTAAKWTYLEICGNVAAGDVATINGKLAAMATAGRNRRAMGHIRGKNAGETEAQYLAAQTTALAAVSSRRLTLAGDSAEIQSSVSRRQYKRPPSFAVAPYVCAVSEEVDVAELSPGPLPGVTIRDANGNPKYHDEFINPGLDDIRLLALRTWEGRTGVYVNNPRLFSPVGSDYLWIQFGRVVDIGCTIAREELEPILSKGVFTKTDGTGQIEEVSALAIESQVNARLARELTGVRKATRAVFTLSRTDNVLQTGEISWSVRIIPLAYIKKMTGTVALVASDKSPANVLG